MSLKPMRWMVGCVFVGLSLGTLWSAEDKPARTNAPGGGAGEDLFTEPKVHSIRIELSDSAQDALRNEPKHYVKATVTEGSKVYSDVGVRLKGGGTNAPALDKKPGWSIKFNEFVKGQSFHGHTRILLDHSRSDPTYLAEMIGGEIFRAAGVPAPRNSFARVELNGKDVGLYVIAEAVNRDFLSRYFKKSKGNLYEGNNVDVNEKLEKDGGDNSEDQTDVRALARATKEADPAQRWKKLAPLLDLDRFISFAAVEVLIWHRDGYVLNRDNYRLYHDPASEQIVFLPHDFGQLCSKADGPILPEWQGLVAKAVLSVPQGQQQYLQTLGKLLGSAFKTEALNARIDALAQLVRPSLASRGDSSLKAFDEALTQLREHLSQRLAFVQKELKNQAGH
ncbi:MAG TPA: CotH kinase family protein [Verrucomicrobiae bacterium]|nr:CotH kinase family protein [Verrucomicrobiae bacterium]